MKKIKLITTGIVSALSIISGISTYVSISNMNSNITSVSTSKNAEESATKYPLVPAQSNGQNSFLSTKNGPLVYWDNKITSLDWFGSERWSIDITQYITVKVDGGSWKRNWYNWDYDRERNILWILGYGYAKSQNQRIVSFNADTGAHLGTYEIDSKVSSTYNKADYKFISALSSGKVLVYGGAQLPSYDAKAILIDPENNTGHEIQGNSAQNIPNDHPGTSKMYLFNIIPIADNRNIVEYVNFATEGGTTTGDGSSKYASYNVYFTLTDDNLNMVATDANDPWSKPIKAVNGVEGFRSTKITPQRDYYFLLDGRVVTVLYNNVVIINPKDTSITTKTKVSFQRYKLEDKKWVLSWTFDTNENLFFKYKDDGKVYRVKASELKNTGFNDEETSFQVSPTTYYDTSGSSSSIKDYANNFVLYNVYGYSGQIMLINAWYNERVNVDDSPNQENQIKNKYGLAVAITENKSDPSYGDSKGFLNGEESFQRSADFEIKDTVLNSKLASEITRNDITITNEGFFTSNSTLENGKLKYPPFTISDIDDSKGTFTITANIDQIPWFATTLPKDSVPKTIKKTFDNKAQKIDSKVSWKNASSLSYDFKNTLPSKLSVEDINNFDPFQVSFNSQTILDSAGNTIYPKKTYSKGANSDSNGSVTINVTYEYIPQGWTYSSEMEPLKYTKSQNYTIFSSSTKKQFFFAGATNAATNTSSENINIKNVPQLKALSESNLLPSSFNSANTNSFLQFINTNKSAGYPISKMDFSFEPNDDAGTLKVTAKVKQSYDQNQETFVQIFSGFNQKTNYSFNFNSAATSIGDKKFENILPSSVNDGDIVNYLIKYEGFNSSDFTINLSADDSEGSLCVEIVLNSSYANSLGNSNGFQNYRIRHTFTGFMTTDKYNNQYNITFKDNTDASLSDLKKMTLNSINESINGSGLQIGDKKYVSLNDLVENLFVSSFGTKIPRNWNESSNRDKITTSMTFNNEAGTMNLSIKIDKSLLDGYDSDLNYVISYNGFSKGNIVPTSDNLTFVSQEMLKTTVLEVANMNVDELKLWITKDNNANLSKLITTLTGEYKTKIESHQYNLTITTNSNYNTITIELEFVGGLTDPDSLTYYSISYQL